MLNICLFTVNHRVWIGQLNLTAFNLIITSTSLNFENWIKKTFLNLRTPKKYFKNNLMIRSTSNILKLISITYFLISLRNKKNITMILKAVTYLYKSFKSRPYIKYVHLKMILKKIFFDHHPITTGLPLRLLNQSS